MGYLAQDLMLPRLHRWRFNLKTGTTTEQRLDDRTIEFGAINPLYQGKKYRYVYSCIPTPGYFTFDGLTTNDLQTGDTQDYLFGDQRYGSEPAFAPRINAQHEQDGYIVSIISDVKRDRSEFVMLDAADITAEPVCRVILPHRICSGVHATWAQGEAIRSAQRNS